MSLAYSLLKPKDAPALAAFFAELAASDVAQTFHPHPLTAQQAEELCAYQGKDIYCLQRLDSQIVGYGMLRGWDEGYTIPSLGIVISPRFQGKGLGRALMLHLHSLASERGAQQVRLKVYSHNAPALRLYQSLGYSFSQTTGTQQIGLLDLRS